MIADRPTFGIFFMILFCALAPLGDAFAKMLVTGSAPIAVLQILLVRYGVQPLLLTPLALATGRSLRMSPRLLGLTALRTALHMAAIFMMFTSLRFLPLADAIAIAYVEPFIMLLIGHYILHEMVGTRRFAACVVGFLGVLMVVQPSFAEVGAPALLPMGVAVAFALFLAVTRVIAKEADPVSLQAVSGLMAFAALSVAFIAMPTLNWEPVSGELWSIQWSLLIGIGVLGTAAHLAMTTAMRFAPTTVLAPVGYLEIPFATAIGLALFGDFPNNLAFAGIVITLAAGLYILYRERVAD